MQDVLSDPNLKAGLIQGKVGSQDVQALALAKLKDLATEPLLKIKDALISETIQDVALPGVMLVSTHSPLIPPGLLEVINPDDYIGYDYDSWNYSTLYQRAKQHRTKYIQLSFNGDDAGYVITGRLTPTVVELPSGSPIRRRAPVK